MRIDEALESEAAQILERFRERDERLATAESCTGGLIAAIFTAVPGASDAFERGFVTYSNRSKIEMLGVDPELLERDGAVSSAVAEAMAKGALSRSGATVSLAVTGLAGPDGGTERKPVGLVYVAMGSRSDVIVERHEFGEIGRAEIRYATVKAGFKMLGSRGGTPLAGSRGSAP